MAAEEEKRAPCAEVDDAGDAAEAEPKTELLQPLLININGKAVNVGEAVQTLRGSGKSPFRTLYKSSVLSLEPGDDKELREVIAQANGGAEVDDVQMEDVRAQLEQATGIGDFKALFAKLHRAHLDHNPMLQLPGDTADEVFRSILSNSSHIYGNTGGFVEDDSLTYSVLVQWLHQIQARGRLSKAGVSVYDTSVRIVYNALDRLFMVDPLLRVKSFEAGDADHTVGYVLPWSGGTRAFVVADGGREEPGLGESEAVKAKLVERGVDGLQRLLEADITAGVGRHPRHVLLLQSRAKELVLSVLVLKHSNVYAMGHVCTSTFDIDDRDTRKDLCHLAATFLAMRTLARVEQRFDEATQRVPRWRLRLRKPRFVPQYDGSLAADAGVFLYEQERMFGDEYDSDGGGSSAGGARGSASAGASGGAGGDDGAARKAEPEVDGAARAGDHGAGEAEAQSTDRSAQGTGDRETPIRHHSKRRAPKVSSVAELLVVLEDGRCRVMKKPPRSTGEAADFGGYFSPLCEVKPGEAARAMPEVAASGKKTPTPRLTTTRRTQPQLDRDLYNHCAHAHRWLRTRFHPQWVVHAAVHRETRSHTCDASCLPVICKLFFENDRSEAKVLRSLSHGSIVPYLGVFSPPWDFQWAEAHIVLLAPELVPLFVDGGLAEHIKSAVDVARLVRQLLGALTYMHARGVLHLDLSPGNVMLSDRSPEARLVIIDFGAAEVLEPGRVEVHRHKPFGTAGFIAPEYEWIMEYDAETRVTEEGVPVGREADMFGAGAVLHKMLKRLPSTEPEVDDGCGAAASAGGALASTASPAASTSSKRGHEVSESLDSAAAPPPTIPFDAEAEQELRRLGACLADDLMDVDWECRPSAQQALRHEFFTTAGVAGDDNDDVVNAPYPAPLARVVEEFRARFPELP